MGIGHGQLVPRTVGKVLGRGCGHEIGGASAHHGQLVSGIEDAVAGAGNGQVGQPLGLNPYLRALVNLLCSKRQHRQQAEQQ